MWFFILVVVMFFFWGCSGKPVVEEKGPRRNLILIVVDTLRADHVSCYGEMAQTPVIDALADQGALFRRAYSHIAVTGPSHSSMFTGVLPFRHRVEKNTDILPESFETLAESLKNEGYSSYAVISLGVLKARFGLSQGFDVYEDHFESQWFLKAEEVTDRIEGILPDTLEKPVFLFAHYSDPHEPYSPPGLDYFEFSVKLNGESLGSCRVDGLGCEFPLLLKSGLNEVSFEPLDDGFEGHLGFRQLEVRASGVDVALGSGWEGTRGMPPRRLNRCQLPATLIVKTQAGQEVPASLSFFADEEIDDAVSRQRYALEVEYVDRQIGRLLELLKQRGLLEHSLVVLTSDHGEGLGQHNLFGHKKQVYDSLIRVPLIVVADGLISPGTEVAAPISHVDMNATIREILGLPPVGQSSGKIALPQLVSDTLDGEVPKISMTFKSSGEVDLRAVILGDYKLIRNLDTGEEEFYSLAQDPDELNDILSTGRLSTMSVKERNALASSGQILDSIARMEASGRHGFVETATLSPEDLARLEALGYTQ